MSKRSFYQKLDKPIFMILCTWLFFTSIAMSAGGKIGGRITDPDNGDPLAGVNVEIVGKFQGAATDVDGYYYIINVPPGVYDIQASIVGYQTITKTNVEVSSDHTTEVNFQLSATVLELDESVVVVAERPMVEMDQTSTRHFVTATEISKRPTNELTEILMTLPGIDVSEGGEFLVRRSTLDQVAFLIDGMRARNPLDFEPYTNINLTAVQELEIITGGFNAEYGEAQSGVFNIITKDGTSGFTGYAEVRWRAPGEQHWGTPFYDYSSDRYWENKNARHLQWWIDNPDMWVDQNGVAGNDPNTLWTPEQAYSDYMETHQPLNNYTDQSEYQVEASLGGPLLFNNLYFFVSGKYRSMPPVTGNSFRDTGTWTDGSLKLTYTIGSEMKLMLSGFYGDVNSNQGLEYMDNGWISAHGLESKYAYYDFPGYPENTTNGLTLQFTHWMNQSTFYNIQLIRIFRHRSQSTFPGDTNGWEEGVPAYDRLRAVDEYGNPIPEGYNNLIGLHTTGYYYRGEDKNTDYTLTADLTSQISRSWQIQAGGDFTYYNLDRFQQAKAFNAIEDAVYNPYEGNIYFQTKLEFKGLIMNLGLRYDFYNPNDLVYLNPFDPFDIYGSITEERPQNPETKDTKSFGQLSPRIGISHPISEKTVLHFSYGHFFQRSTFGNYGEGTYVTGILNTYLAGDDVLAPYNLGNRELNPRKTVAYELGIEHSIGGIVADVTAYYKDETNTVRSITVFTLDGGRYLTAGNGDYGDSKGVEISVRKPLSGFWGGYLNYTWSTGITGRSGDPDVIAPPGSNVQVGTIYDIGDFINYDPPRLKLGITLATPRDFSPLLGLLSNVQLSFDYQVYYPHERIASHVFSEAGTQYIRYADKNANIRLRKEFNIGGFRPAVFIEVRNAFNNTNENIDVVKASSPEDRVNFINSRFSVFPDVQTNGAPFPDMTIYRNLPRRLYIGAAIGF